jgi:hypothetical protein
MILYIIYYNQFDQLENKSDDKYNIDKVMLYKKINILNQLIKSNKPYDKFILFELNHLKIISGDLPLKVVWNGYTEAGYANKIYSMLSSLVLAILSDSAFFIQWKFIEKFIEEPFYLTFKKFSKKSLFNPEYKNNEIYYVKASSNAWKHDKDMEMLIKTSLPKNKTRIIYNSYDPYFFEICSNPNFIKKLHEYRLVDISTIEKVYYIQNNWENISNDFKTDYLLQVGFEVGGNLLNKLWRPNAQLKKKIDYYLKNIFINYYVIGIQLRVEFLNDKIGSSDISTFIDCACNLEKKVLKENIKFNQIYKGGY